MKNLFEIGKKVVGEIMNTAQRTAQAAKGTMENTRQSSTQRVQVSEEDKRMLAYHLWEQAGCPDGRSDEFWFKAEAALEDQPTSEFSDDSETVVTPVKKG